MGFFEGAKLDHQRARRENRLPLGALTVFDNWENIDAATGLATTQRKLLCLIVGVWRWNPGGSREMLFNVDRRAEDCNTNGYLLLPSGAVGWRYAFYGDLGMSLSAA